MQPYIQIDWKRNQVVGPTTNCKSFCPFNFFTYRKILIELLAQINSLFTIQRIQFIALHISECSKFSIASKFNNQKFSHCTIFAISRSSLKLNHTEPCTPTAHKQCLFQLEFVGTLLGKICTNSRPKFAHIPEFQH